MERRGFLKSLSLIAAIPIVDKLSFLAPAESIPADATEQTDYKTNGVERMRLFSNGSIGIGTTSPSTMLKIKTY